MRAILKRMLRLSLLGICISPLQTSAATYCSITTASVAFGAYDALGSNRRDTVGSISVTCTGIVGDNVSYSILLDTVGQNGSYRVMTNGVYELYYVLYTDSSYMQVWGDGSAGTNAIADNYTMVSSRTSRTYSVFGRIPAHQSHAKSGDYTANLSITLSY